MEEPIIYDFFRQLASRKEVTAEDQKVLLALGDYFERHKLKSLYDLDKLRNLEPVRKFPYQR